MASSIENMMRKAVKDYTEFNPYLYYEDAVANQFVFAIDGPASDFISVDNAVIVRIVPKNLWDKKKLFFTEELNLSFILGPNSQDLNGTGSWILPDFSRDIQTCAEQLVDKGFVWDAALQSELNKQVSNDAKPWNSANFTVNPHVKSATQTNKTITPEIELEIFEHRLGIKTHGVQHGILKFYKVIRTAPITKEKTILEFLKKYKVPYNAKIDEFSDKTYLPTTLCWLDKSEVLKHYINDIPKDMCDEYGKTLLDIAKQYKAIKSYKILIENGFTLTNTTS